MKKTYLLLIQVLFMLSLNAQMQLGLISSGSLPEVTLQATLDIGYNDQGLTGYHFVIRIPEADAANVSIGTFTAGNQLPSPVMQNGGSITSGGFKYTVYTSNAAVDPNILTTWTAGATVPIVSFNAYPTVPPGTVTNVNIELALEGDPIADQLIDALYGDGSAPFVYASDIIMNGAPTVDGFTTTLVNAPLPIKLSSFTAERFGDRASILRWTSVSEVNASHFEIERSIDNIEWTHLGDVKAAGNSNTSIDYSFTDKNLPFSREKKDVFYYRLKQVDIDGDIEYSEVRSVIFTNESIVTVKAYPNPTTDIVKVEMTATTGKGDANLYLMDVSGKLITKKTISTNGITELNIGDLQNAAYDIMVEYNGQTFHQKVIKTN